MPLPAVILPRTACFPIIGIEKIFEIRSGNTPPSEVGSFWRSMVLFAHLCFDRTVRQMKHLWQYGVSQINLVRSFPAKRLVLASVEAISLTIHGEVFERDSRLWNSPLHPLSHITLGDYVSQERWTRKT
jgi:hypothetical protein